MLVNVASPKEGLTFSKLLHKYLLINPTNPNLHIIQIFSIRINNKTKRKINKSEYMNFSINFKNKNGIFQRNLDILLRFLTLCFSKYLRS